MLRNTAIATLFFSGIVVATTLPAHALQIARYEFGTTTTGSPLSNDTEPNSTAGNFGANGVTATGTAVYSAGEGGSGSAITRSGWSTTGIDLNKFYTFTVTPNSGVQMSLNSLAFAARRSPSGPQTIEVRSSLNYATPLSIFSLPTADVFSPLLVSLPGTSFGNLTSPIEFRIYGYNAGGTTGSLRLDNVTLEGTVAVPFGFTPIWGIAANGIVFGLRKLRNKQTKNNSDSLTAEA